MNDGSTTRDKTRCPACGGKLKRVGAVTLGALLKDEFAGPFSTTGPSCCDTGGAGCEPVSGETGWRFCDAADCDVVYVSEAGDTRFTKAQLKVPVGVKETSGARPLCYCFGHSIASIKDELRATGHSTALDDIRAKMKDPGCFCETSNPSGACCLGAVTKGIRIAQEELSMGDTRDTPAETVAPRNSAGGRVAQIGAVASAVMASACCWLPLVLLAAGASGAGIAATLEAYRPLLMVVTFGFLGSAFYFTYRPRPAAAGEGCCATEPDRAKNHNAPTGKRRFNPRATRKAMLWVVSGLAVVFLLFPHYVGFLLADRRPANEPIAEGAAVTKTALRIDGMTCEGCAVILQKRLGKTPGVLNATVDFAKKRAIVSTEADDPFPEREVLEAIEESGFNGRLP